jgi:hypothetical protein
MKASANKISFTEVQRRVGAIETSPQCDVLDLVEQSRENDQTGHRVRRRPKTADAVTDPAQHQACDGEHDHVNRDERNGIDE